MTLLAKVFTVLIFRLSVIFFAFAVVVNASHVNTRDVASKYSQEAQAAEARNRQLESLRENYKSELEIEQISKRAALAALQSQYEAAAANLLQLEVQAGELRKALTVATQTNDSTQRDLRDAADQNRDLRAQIDEARAKRDQLFDSLVTAKQEFNQFQGTLQSLSERAQSVEP